MFVKGFSVMKHFYNHQRDRSYLLPYLFTFISLFFIII